MNTYQDALLRRSYHLLMLLPSKMFTRYFLTQLSDEYPELVIYSVGNAEYHERIVFTLIALAKESTVEDSPHTAILRILGRKHQYRNIPRAHLINYIQCLLRSAATFLGDVWTPEMNDMWTTLLMDLIDVLKQDAVREPPMVPDLMI